MSSRAYIAQSSVARPANTTAYAAGDVVGAAAAALEFPGFAPVGEALVIVDASLRVDVAALPSGMVGFRLHLYSGAPASNLADNAAWDLPAGDRASYLGFIDLGTPVDVGSTLFVQTDSLPPKVIRMGASTSLWGYLVTLGGFTPSSGTVKTVRFSALGA